MNFLLDWTADPFISVRCALNPPPCFLLWLFGRQVGELQNQPKRNANTIAKNVMADKWANAKSNQKSIQKLTKIIENRVWDHPRGSRGRLGDQFGPRAAHGSKRAPKRSEILVRFWHQNGDPGPTFRGLFFSWGARVAGFSWFWVPADPILASILVLLGELWAFGKNSWKCCSGGQFQRFGPCQTEFFYRSWL